MTEHSPIEQIPNQEALVEFLSAEGAPPFITLDLDGSDGDDLAGIIHVALGEDGKLYEVLD